MKIKENVKMGRRDVEEGKDGMAVRGGRWEDEGSEWALLRRYHLSKTVEVKELATYISEGRGFQKEGISNAKAPKRWHGVCKKSQGNQHSRKE